MARPQLPKERRAFIAELAEAVADEHCPSGFVEPGTIIEANEITSSFGKYGDTFDGMLECEQRRFHIYFNQDRLERPDSGRSRFTLAHELGHFYVDEHRNGLLGGVSPHGSVCDFNPSTLIELEADTFASNLLLPPGRFRDTAVPREKPMAEILRLADEFRTSRTCTALRYLDDDIAPCTIIKWDEDFSWKRFSPETFRARYRKTIEARSLLPVDSATARALSGESPPASGFFETGSAASIWFPFIKPGDPMDLILIEQAVPLGRFGVLTLLYPEQRSYGRQW